MSTIKSGVTDDLLTVDPVSKAARISLYDSSGNTVSLTSNTVTTGLAGTFSVANTFTPVANATDMVHITGNAGITKIWSFIISTTNLAAGSQEFRLIKRYGFNLPAPQALVTGVPHDSNDVAVALSFPGHYTSNPVVAPSNGVINIVRVASTAPVPNSFAAIRYTSAVEMLPVIDGVVKPITLRTSAEALVLNFNGAANVAGQTHAFRIMWTEQPN